MNEITDATVVALLPVEVLIMSALDYNWHCLYYAVYLFKEQTHEHE